MRNPAVFWVVGHEESGRPLVRMVSDILTTDDRTDLAVVEDVMPLQQKLFYIPHRDRYTVPHIVEVSDVEFPKFDVGDVFSSESALGWPEDDTHNSVCLTYRQKSYSIFSENDKADIVSSIKKLGNAKTELEVLNLTSAEFPKSEKEISWSPFHISFIEYSADAERAQRQNNDVLVFAWRGESEIETHILSSTGSYMFFNQDGSNCQDCGIDVPDEPGLWIMRDGKYWSHRDWESDCIDDYGLEGNYVQATLSEAADFMGATEEDLLSEMNDVYPYIIDENSSLMDVIHLPSGAQPEMAPTA